MRIKVSVIYKDDSVEEFTCVDAPFLGNDWVTIYPVSKNSERINLAAEAIHRVEYHYE